MTGGYTWANYNEYQYWENVEIDEEDKLHYIDISHSKLIVNNNEVHPKMLEKIVYFLEQHGLLTKGTEIFGVRNSFSKRIKKKWTDIGKLFIDNFDTHLKQGEYEKNAALINFWLTTNYDNKAIIEIKPLITNKKILNLIEFLDKCKIVEKDKQKVDIVKELAILKGAQWVEPPITNFNVEELKTLKPLVKYISSTHFKDPAVLDYLNS